MMTEFLRQARRFGAGRLSIPGPLRDALRSALWRTMFRVAPPASLQPGLALIGYPRAEFGLGEALRLLAAAIERSGLPFAAFDIDHGIWARQGDRRLAARISPVLDRRVNLLVDSANYAGHAVRLLGPAAFAGRRNIFYALWELPELPEAWLGHLAPFDEIWAPSQFVADALAARLPGRVFRLPLPMDLPALPARTRADFGLPADRFLFHFSFDFSSFAERKNPWGVVDAFRRCAAALPPGRVGLVLKAMGEGHGRAGRRRLAQALEGDEDIFVIDRVLGRPEVLALQSVCDCFVSLHRSEGFGLCIAEAMALAKPVVATDFGGARDLLAAAHACPVGYRLVPVLPDQYPGGAGQFWADPDIAEAATLMRRLAEDADLARRLGVAGQAFIREVHSPEVIGARIHARLADAPGLAA